MVQRSLDVQIFSLKKKKKLNILSGVHSIKKLSNLKVLSSKIDPAKIRFIR